VTHQPHPPERPRPQRLVHFQVGHLDVLPTRWGVQGGGVHALVESSSAPRQQGLLSAGGNMWAGVMHSAVMCCHTYLQVQFTLGEARRKQSASGSRQTCMQKSESPGPSLTSSSEMAFAAFVRFGVRENMVKVFELPLSVGSLLASAAGPGRARLRADRGRF
jgi:hypothetical protein